MMSRLLIVAATITWMAPSVLAKPSCKTARACVAAAKKLQAKHPKPSAAVVEEALGYYEKACSLGDGRSCRKAGMLIRDSAPDTKRMRSAFGLGCTLEDALSCSELGMVLVKTDPKEARKLFTSACKLDHPLGCHNLAVLHRDGLGGPKDAKAAEDTAAKACRLKRGDACSTQAMLLEKRLGKTSKGAPAATRLLEKGCALASGECCGAAGTRYAIGYGAAKQPKRARVLLERGCKLKNGSACHHLGLAWVRGLLGKADQDRGFEALAKSCRLKHGPGCAYLAVAAHKAGKASVGGFTVNQLKDATCTHGVKAPWCTPGRKPRR